MLSFAITPGVARNAADAAALHAQVLQLPPVDFLLLREKHLPAADLLALTLSFGQTLHRISPHTRLLLARRLDVALAAAAAGLAPGIHLSAAPGELTPTQVRTLLPGAFVSTSCHTLDEVRAACTAGASAILFAPVFGKLVAGAQVVAGQGLPALRAACHAAGPVPVFALGSVTRADAPACQDAGAAGIAGIRLFFPSAIPLPAEP